MVNLLLVEVGPHSKRIYLPLIKKYKDKYNINLKIIVDIEKNKKELHNYLKKNDFEIEEYYVNYNIDKEYHINNEDLENLNKLVRKYKINAMILATDPLAHKSYMDFALENGINILMDKPVTTEIDASTNQGQAKKIFNDFVKILDKYHKAEEKYPSLIVSCLSQRRYHPAINKIRGELQRVYERTNCPITSIICEHSDGQWRMPDEIISEKYHGYTNGIGKCSHSGYHFFDIMHWFGEISKENCKIYDKITCYSSFTRPSDWISQLNIEDYKKIFGNSYNNGKFNLSNEEFIEKTKNFGEIDAHLNFSFYKDNNKLLNIQFSLLHNGFSRRSWVEARENLYKGNGRIRHEYFSIHQGPFQSIKYESYQSDQIDNETLMGSGQVGGELHSDVYIFRNSKAIGIDLPPMEQIQFGIVNENGLQGYSRGHQEDARGECFKEFMMAVNGEIPKGKLKSSIEAHKGSVTLMSLAYLSGAKIFNGKENPIATFDGNCIK